MGMIPWGESVLKQANDAEMMSEDAHPIHPFHEVVRSHGMKYAGGSHENGVRTNTYSHPHNPNVKVELHHTQKKGPSFGETNSITSSHHSKATAPNVNNSPDRLDRNIHNHMYVPPENIPSKNKPSEIKEYAKHLEK